MLGAACVRNRFYFERPVLPGAIRSLPALLLVCPCSDRLTELRRAIEEEQEAAHAGDKVYPAAFVTFNRRTSQVRGGGRRWRKNVLARIWQQIFLLCC